MTPTKESAYEIIKATYEELVQTSGLSDNYLAGQLLAVGVNVLLKNAGHLGTISILMELAQGLTKAAMLDNLNKRIN